VVRRGMAEPPAAIAVRRAALREARALGGAGGGVDSVAEGGGVDCVAEGEQVVDAHQQQAPMSRRRRRQVAGYRTRLLKGDEEPRGLEQTVRGGPWRVVVKLVSRIVISYNV
jgi:hypothetical protein